MDKVLLFDFDGTIADSFESFLKIVPRISENYNLPTIPREELEKLRSEEPRTIIKRLNIPFFTIPLLARDMKKMQQHEIDSVKPFENLPTVLQTLKVKGYTLGILTSNGKENVERFLQNNNLPMFDAIYSDSSIFGKDVVLRNFLKKHNLLKENVRYIGDEIRDIQACQKVGIKMIAVTWGFNSKEGLINYHPDFLIDKPEELLQLLEKS
jgi:phosphoglycolate phosphatase-like HAD superfamily hydrolase